MSQIKTVKIKDGDDFRVINESDFKRGVHELCEGEKLSTAKQITVSLNAETAPELQQVINDAKAECKKVVAENKDLSDQLKKSIDDLQAERIEFTAFKNDVVAMQARIDELKKADGGITGHLVEVDQVNAESSPDTPVSEANTDYANWTVPQIKDFLASKEIGFKSSVSKEELLALIPKE